MDPVAGMMLTYGIIIFGVVFLNWREKTKTNKQIEFVSNLVERNNLGKVKFDRKKYVSPNLDSPFTRDRFTIHYEDVSIGVSPERILDTPGKHYGLEMVIPIEVPEFEMTKSTNISNIIFTSELFPAELSNANIKAPNITQVAMWLNVSTFLKFIQFFLPLKSKYTVIKSTGKQIEINTFCERNIHAVIEQASVVVKFYENMKDILQSDTKKEIRITKDVINYHCQACGSPSKFEQSTCNFCTSDLSECVICYQALTQGARMLNCCGSYLHQSHISDMGNRCPYCKTEEFETITVH